MKGKEDDVDKAPQTKILLTSLSAMVAETTTSPIDITKTRLQLHGDDHSSSSSSRRSASASAFRIATDMVRREGLLGLYKGLTPAIIRHLFYTPIRIVGYEHLRTAFFPDDRPASLSSKALIGGVSGVFAQVIASPADLIKVRMQADGRMISQGLQPRRTYLGSEGQTINHLATSVGGRLDSGVGSPRDPRLGALTIRVTSSFLPMSEWIEDWICAPPDIPPQRSIRIHQSSSPPGIYPMNMAEECAKRLSNIVSLSRMRLATLGSEGKTTIHPGLFEEGIQALVSADKRCRKQCHCTSFSTCVTPFRGCSVETYMVALIGSFFVSCGG